MDLARCLWAVLPPALLWGASFPLALASVASRGQDPGRMVGGVYAANTVGAIVGAVTFSVFLIGSVGTQNCQRVLIALSAASGLLVLLPQVWPLRSWLRAAGGPHPEVGPARAGHCGHGWLAVRGGGGGAVGLGRAGRPRRTGRLRPHASHAGQREARDDIEASDAEDDPDDSDNPEATTDPIQRVERKIVYVGEGMNSSVAVSEAPGTESIPPSRSFHVSGKVEASTIPQDMRLQRMLGHIPALLHPNPRSVLIVGCGAGVTAGTFTQYPDVERIVICEIEPLIPELAAEVLRRAELRRSSHDPTRVEVVYDDARHFILTTDEKFDIITSDPIHPWVKGSATLYTKEYFELCKKRLNPGGHGHAVGAALRVDRADGQERGRHVLRCLPQRHDLEQRPPRQGLRRRPAGLAGADDDQHRRSPSACA